MRCATASVGRSANVLRVLDPAILSVHVCVSANAVVSPQKRTSAVDDAPLVVDLARITCVTRCNDPTLPSGAGLWIGLVDCIEVRWARGERQGCTHYAHMFRVRVGGRDDALQ